MCLIASEDNKITKNGFSMRSDFRRLVALLDLLEPELCYWTVWLRPDSKIVAHTCLECFA
jgi:hypothetical protein